MLSKCANPSCTSSFRYLHQGRLFRFEIELQENVREDIPDKPRRYLEYFWLCDECSASMTLCYDHDSGVRAVHLAQKIVASEIGN